MLMNVNVNICTAAIIAADYFAASTVIVVISHVHCNSRPTVAIIALHQLASLALLQFGLHDIPLLLYAIALFS